MYLRLSAAVLCGGVRDFVWAHRRGCIGFACQCKAHVKLYLILATIDKLKCCVLRLVPPPHALLNSGKNISQQTIRYGGLPRWRGGVTAVITTGGVLEGSGVTTTEMAPRTGTGLSGRLTFYRHNNKRVNRIIKVPGEPHVRALDSRRLNHRS